MRAKFRETLWFKKGEQDAKVADEAVAAGDLLAPQAVDMLPIEDRYEDDGSVAATDSVAFGIHTGKTEYMPKVGGWIKIASFPARQNARTSKSMASSLPTVVRQGVRRARLTRPTALDKATP